MVTYTIEEFNTFSHFQTVLLNYCLLTYLHLTFNQVESYPDFRLEEASRMFKLFGKALSLTNLRKTLFFVERLNSCVHRFFLRFV